MKYDEDFLISVKEGLLLLRQGHIEDRTLGICFNLSALISDYPEKDVFKFVYYHCVGWNGVKEPTDWPISYHLSHPDAWKGKLLEKRLSLIEHIIKQCDKLLTERE